MSELTPHEVLCEARNLIDREGWWSGHLKQLSGTCASNAISTVLTAHDPEWCDFAAQDALGAAIEVGGGNVCRIFKWNDAPGRTKAEVLAAFDRAISATAPSPADPLEGVEMAEVVA